MTRNDKKIQDILNKLFKRASSQPRVCSFPGCTNSAINSHILQKNGILNGIQQDGHIRISQTDFLNPELFHFKREGINQSFTFKGFCPDHDKSVFSPIEDFEIDFEDYRSQLLFNYRTVLNENVRKEVLLDWHKFQKESNSLKGIIDVDYINKSDEQQRIGIKEIKYYLDRIESDLANNTKSFTFRYRYTRSCEICLASHFTFETTREQQNEINKTGKDFDLLTAIFISFFPLENENVFIMGYLKEHESKCGAFVQSFFDCSEDELFKKLSNLLLCRCEMWACSDSFYYKFLKPRETEINGIFQQSAISIDEDRTLEINIFQ